MTAPNENVDPAVADSATSEAADSATSEPVGDTLPHDLDLAAAQLSPYQFPDVKRRNIAAKLYLLMAGASVFFGVDSSNGGLIAGGIIVALIAGYHLACAWPLKIDQTEALATASREVGFAAGHASAQVTWRGLRSKPMWRVVIYSIEEPPLHRGIVELDAVDGHVVFSTSERNPEDWSDVDAAQTSATTA